MSAMAGTASATTERARRSFFIAVAGENQISRALANGFLVICAICGRFRSKYAPRGCFGRHRRTAHGGRAGALEPALDVLPEVAEPRKKVRPKIDPQAQVGPGHNPKEIPNDHHYPIPAQHSD